MSFINNNNQLSLSDLSLLIEILFGDQLVSQSVIQTLDLAEKRTMGVFNGL